MPYPLIADIAQGRCLPFVGAGFSKNASLPPGYAMPDWAQLAAALAKDAEVEPGTPAPTVAQRYEKRFGRVQLIEAIREALHVDKARPGEAHRAFALMPFDTVYTTNFALLLEEAYAEATRPFRSLVGELQLPFRAGRTAASIIKMHGDRRHEEHIVVTQSDYDLFMERYPVVATHLSAMLITRTPIFVGYSLSDPGFEHVRQVVRARLGAFERMAYVLQFGAEPKRVEEALEAKLHIISLNGSSGNRDEVLASFFREIQSQLDTKAGINLRSSRPDVFEKVESERVHEAVQLPGQSSIIETTSRLCFVMMPFGQRFDDVYRLLISPVVEESGLAVLRADEMAGPGFFMEQIRTAVQQSRLCIADLTGTNPNVMFEIGYAQAAGKPLILLAEQGAHLPFDVAHQRVIFYGPELESARGSLQRTIAVAFSSDRLEEAARLFDLGQYRATIAAGAVVLEHGLRQMFAKRPPESLGRMSLGQMLRIARQRKLLTSRLGSRLEETVQLRNRAVHAVEQPSREQAQFVLKAVREFLEKTGSEG